MASLFADPEDERSRQLMATLDVINRRWGRGTLRSVAEEALADEAATPVTWLHHGLERSARCPCRVMQP